MIKKRVENKLRFAKGETWETSSNVFMDRPERKKKVESGRDSLLELLHLHSSSSLERRGEERTLAIFPRLKRGRSGDESGRDIATTRSTAKKVRREEKDQIFIIRMIDSSILRPFSSLGHHWNVWSHLMETVGLEVKLKAR